MTSDSSNQDRLTRVLNTSITIVSLIGCLGFLVALLGIGIVPAGSLLSERGEVLSVLPTGADQNPIPRAFDQVTGVLEAVFRLDTDLRVEFVPKACFEAPEKQDPESPTTKSPTAKQRPAECGSRVDIGEFVRPTTKFIVAPGTSKGTELVFPKGMPKPTVPVLLTSVTGDDTIKRLVELGATPTAMPNSRMAKRLAERIGTITDHQCDASGIRSNGGKDPAYSGSLEQALRDELSRSCADSSCPCSSPGKNIYILIANEDWWDSGERRAISDAKYVFLSDGLSSARVLKGVERAAPRAKIFATRISVVDPGPCQDADHRPLVGQDGVPYNLHVVAREATCMFMEKLLAGRHVDSLETKVELEPLQVDRDGPT